MTALSFMPTESMPLMQKGLQLGGYHRISQMNGRDPEDNLSEQVAFDQIDAWARLRGQHVHRYVDRDRKGSKLSRPELDRMIADLEAGTIHGVVVAQTDRLSRAEVGDALRMIRRILDIAPGQLALLDLGVDPTTPMGEFSLTVLLGLARMQWRRYQAQYASAQVKAVDRGVWIGRPPFGYRKTIVGHTAKGKPIAGPLEFDPDTAPTVRLAYQLAAEGDVHAAHALLAPTQAAWWSITDTRKLLGRKAYLGEQHHGGLHNLHAHPPITDPTTWAAAQTDTRFRAPSGMYVLTGVTNRDGDPIVRCAKCGAHMVGGVQVVQGKRQRRMRCAGHSSAKCTTSIKAESLEEYVRGAIAELLGDPAAAAYLRSLAPDGLGDARVAMETAEAELASFGMDLEARRMLGADNYHAAMRLRSDEADRTRGEFNAIAAVAGRAAQLPTADQLDDPEQFQRALRVAVDRIVVGPGRRVDRRVDLAWVDGGVNGTRVLAA